MKYRRGGFTTFEQGISYSSVATIPNIECVTLGPTKTDTSKIFKMVRMMHDKNPAELKTEFDSKTEISYNHTGSSFHIGTAGSKSFGRGLNIHRAHGSEVAFWDMSLDDIDNLTAGLSEAAKFGEVVYETTANGTQGWFYEKYKEAQEGKNEWTPLFYPWFVDLENYRDYTDEEKAELIDTLEPEEAELVERHNVNVGQLLWRRAKKRELKKLFPQEYPSNWTEAFIVRGSKFFDSKMLDKMSYFMSDPVEQTDTYTIWVQPEEGRKYVMGADPAEGNEHSDNSIAYILDYETCEQVAMIHGKWRPEVFARKCIQLCKKFNYAVFACEINNHGHSVLNTVINQLRYKFVYYRRDDLKKDAKKKKIVDKKPGWSTNAQTRPILLDELNEALEEELVIINDPLFISEARTFVDIGGKYQADKGQHDDRIMAMGIAYQARKVPRRKAEIL